MAASGRPAYGAPAAAMPEDEEEYDVRYCADDFEAAALKGDWSAFYTAHEEKKAARHAACMELKEKYEQQAWKDRHTRREQQLRRQRQHLAQKRHAQRRGSGGDAPDDIVAYNAMAKDRATGTWKLVQEAAAAVDNASPLGFAPGMTQDTISVKSPATSPLGGPKPVPVPPLPLLQAIQDDPLHTTAAGGEGASLLVSPPPAGSPDAKLSPSALPIPLLQQTHSMYDMSSVGGHNPPMESVTFGAGFSVADSFDTLSSVWRTFVRELLRTAKAPLPKQDTYKYRPGGSVPDPAMFTTRLWSPFVTEAEGGCRDPPIAKDEPRLGLRACLVRLVQVGVATAQELCCRSHPRAYKARRVRACCVWTSMHDVLHRVYHDMEDTACRGFWGDPLGRATDIDAFVATADEAAEIMARDEAKQRFAIYIAAQRAAAAWWAPAIEPLSVTSIGGGSSVVTMSPLSPRSTMGGVARPYSPVKSPKALKSPFAVAPEVALRRKGSEPKSPRGGRGRSAAVPIPASIQPKSNFDNKEPSKRRLKLRGQKDADDDNPFPGGTATTPQDAEDAEALGRDVIEWLEVRARAALIRLLSRAKEQTFLVNAAQRGRDMQQVAENLAALIVWTARPDIAVRISKHLAAYAAPQHAPATVLQRNAAVVEGVAPLLRMLRGALDVLPKGTGAVAATAGWAGREVVSREALTGAVTRASQTTQLSDQFYFRFTATREEYRLACRDDPSKGGNISWFEHIRLPYPATVVLWDGAVPLSPELQPAFEDSAAAVLLFPEASVVDVSLVSMRQGTYREGIVYHAHTTSFAVDSYIPEVYRRELLGDGCSQVYTLSPVVPTSAAPHAVTMEPVAATLTAGAGVSVTATPPPQPVFPPEGALTLSPSGFDLPVALLQGAGAPARQPGVVRSPTMPDLPAGGLRRPSAPPALSMMSLQSVGSGHRSARPTPRLGGPGATSPNARSPGATGGPPAPYDPTAALWARLAFVRLWEIVRASTVREPWAAAAFADRHAPRPALGDDAVDFEELAQAPQSPTGAAGGAGKGGGTAAGGTAGTSTSAAAGAKAPDAKAMAAAREVEMTVYTPLYAALGLAEGACAAAVDRAVPVESDVGGLAQPWRGDWVQRAADAVVNVLTTKPVVIPAPDAHIAYELFAALQAQQVLVAVVTVDVGTVTSCGKPAQAMIQFLQTSISGTVGPEGGTQQRQQAQPQAPGTPNITSIAVSDVHIATRASDRSVSVADLRLGAELPGRGGGGNKGGPAPPKHTGHLLAALAGSGLSAEEKDRAAHWLADVDCFVINCVDLQQAPDAMRQAQHLATGQLRAVREVSQARTERALHHRIVGATVERLVKDAAKFAVWSLIVHEEEAREMVSLTAFDAFYEHFYVPAYFWRTKPHALAVAHSRNVGGFGGGPGGGCGAAAGRGKRGRPHAGNLEAQQKQHARHEVDLRKLTEKHERCRRVELYKYMKMDLLKVWQTQRNLPDQSTALTLQSLSFSVSDEIRYRQGSELMQLVHRECVKRAEVVAEHHAEWARQAAGCMPQYMQALHYLREWVQLIRPPPIDGRRRTEVTAASPRNLSPQRATSVGQTADFAFSQLPPLEKRRQLQQAMLDPDRLRATPPSAHASAFPPPGSSTTQELTLPAIRSPLAPPSGSPVVETTTNATTSGDQGQGGDPRRSGSGPNLTIDVAAESMPPAGEAQQGGSGEAAAAAALPPASPRADVNVVHMLYRKKVFVRDCPPPLSPMAARLMYPYQPQEYVTEAVSPTPGLSGLGQSPRAAPFALEPATPLSVERSAHSGSVPGTPAVRLSTPLTAKETDSVCGALASPRVGFRRARVGMHGRHAHADGSAGAAWQQTSLVEFWGFPPDRSVVCLPDAMIHDFDGAGAGADICTATDIVGAARDIVPPLRKYAEQRARQHAKAKTGTPTFELAAPPMRKAGRGRPDRARGPPSGVGTASATPLQSPSPMSGASMASTSISAGGRSTAAPGRDGPPGLAACARLVTRCLAASRREGLPRCFAAVDLAQYALRVACASLLVHHTQAGGGYTHRVSPPLGRPHTSPTPTVPSPPGGSPPPQQKGLKQRRLQPPQPLLVVGPTAPQVVAVTPGLEGIFYGVLNWDTDPLLCPLRQTALVRRETSSRAIVESWWASVWRDMRHLHEAVVEERTRGGGGSGAHAPGGGGGGSARAQNEATIHMYIVMTREYYARKAIRAEEEEAFRAAMLPLTMLATLPLRSRYRHPHSLQLDTLFTRVYVRDYLAATGLVLLPYVDRMVVLWSRSVHSIPAVVEYVAIFRNSRDAAAHCTRPASPMTVDEARSLTARQNARRPAWAGDVLKAAETGDVGVMSLLAYLGVPVHILTTTLGGSRRGPMHIACHNGHATCLRPLAEMGVDVNAETDAGMAAIHIAAVAGQVACIEVLLELGVSVCAVDSARGWTALHFAMHHGRDDVARVLVAAGASASAVDIWGSTPVDAADAALTSTAPRVPMYPAPPTRTTFWEEDTCKAWGSAGATRSHLTDVPQAMYGLMGLAIAHEQRALAAAGKKKGGARSKGGSGKKKKKK